MFQPATHTRQTAPTALIVGAGYLGHRLAQILLTRGVTVYGTVRSQKSAARLNAIGVRPLLLNVEQLPTLAALRTLNTVGPLDVFYMVPPGRMDADPPAQVVVKVGVTNITKALKRADLRAGVLVSSTSVYGSSRAAVVDADSPAEPLDPRGRLLLDAENIWLSARHENKIVRLAGIYGPGRIIGKQAILQSSPIAGDPNATINLIHVEDAASLLLQVASQTDAAVTTDQHPHKIELGCDDQPCTRLTYYTALAQKLRAPAPALLSEAQAVMLGLNVDRLRNAANKTCSNLPTKKRTGWSPRFSTFDEGLNHALAAESADTTNNRNNA